MTEQEYDFMWSGCMVKWSGHRMMFVDEDMPGENVIIADEFGERKRLPKSDFLRDAERMPFSMREVSQGI